VWQIPRLIRRVPTALYLLACDNRSKGMRRCVGFGVKPLNEPLKDWVVATESMQAHQKDTRNVSS